MFGNRVPHGHEHLSIFASVTYLLPLLERLNKYLVDLYSLRSKSQTLIGSHT